MKKIVGIFFCMLLLATTCSAFGTTATQADDIPKVNITIKGGFGLHVIVNNIGDVPIEKFSNGCGSSPGALGNIEVAGRSILSTQVKGGSSLDIYAIPVGQTLTQLTFPELSPKAIATWGTMTITIYENGDMFNWNGIPNEMYGSQTFQVLMIGHFLVFAPTK